MGIGDNAYICNRIQPILAGRALLTLATHVNVQHFPAPIRRMRRLDSLLPAEVFNMSLRQLVAVTEIQSPQK